MPGHLDHEGERTLIEHADRRPEVFHELYQHYFSRIYAYVAYRVGRQQDAEDLVADIFLKAMDEINRFEYRGAGSLAAWVFRIARNRVTDFHRRNHRRKEPVSLEELPELQASALLPADVVLQKERFARLHRLIGTLSPRRQEVITLRFFGGLRNKEIAEILELDERTVASHLCRGLEDLHRKYVDELMRTKEEDRL